MMAPGDRASGEPHRDQPLATVRKRDAGCGGCLRIVKVGGSLFDLPDLAARLQRLLAHAPPPDPDVRRPGCNTLIAGGGALADAVRRYDAVQPFDEAFVHNIAVETMRLMAALLAERTGLSLVRTEQELEHAQCSGEDVVLDVGLLLSDVEPTAPGRTLKRDWSVTSDSIAARLAEVLGARQVWLLKSASPADADLESLIRQGIVDTQFPRHARRLQWQVVNLRRQDQP